MNNKIDKKIPLTNFEILLGKELLKVFEEQKENERVTIRYGDLAKRFGNNISANHLAIPLGHLSEFCASLGLPYISAIVINKDGIPGDKFMDVINWELQNKTFNQILEEAQTRKDWKELADYLNRF